MDTACKNAINFLLWSYFNLTLGDGGDASGVLDTCIQKAYLDATQQGAYTALIPKDRSDLKEASLKAKENSEKKIHTAISELCKDEDERPKCFNKWHSILCNELVIKHRKIKLDKDALFSYGNAQKWVNMTLKYLYILYPLYAQYNDRNCAFCKKFGKMIEHYRKDFHVPVDSFIMEGIWEWDKWEGDEDFLPLREGKKHKDKYSSDKLLPWSRWDKKDYEEKFRDKMRDKVTEESLLDWEGSMWIKIAKKRKKK